MFGSIPDPDPDPASPAPSEIKPAKPASALGEMAAAFFASRGGKVSVGSNPRPGRPGTPAPQRALPARAYAATAPFSPFAAVGDAAARARQEAMAAEADIVDDMFFESDAPAC
jgi:hypothetical protein